MSTEGPASEQNIPDWLQDVSRLGGIQGELCGLTMALDWIGGE